jgi:hypothetical protein
VLAIWPPDAVLELAECLVLDSFLCVIAGHYDIRASGDEAIVTYEMKHPDGRRGRNTEILTPTWCSRQL